MLRQSALPRDSAGLGPLRRRFGNCRRRRTLLRARFCQRRIVAARFVVGKSRIRIADRRASCGRRHAGIARDLDVSVPAGSRFHACLDPRSCCSRAEVPPIARNTCCQGRAVCAEIEWPCAVAPTRQSVVIRVCRGNRGTSLRSGPSEAQSTYLLVGRLHVEHGGFVVGSGEIIGQHAAHGLEQLEQVRL